MSVIRALASAVYDPSRVTYEKLLVPATEFYRAEEYHQHFYRKNPVRYHFYRDGCGRDARLKELWGSAPK